jgi:hypothetical protein
MEEMEKLVIEFKFLYKLLYNSELNLVYNKIDNTFLLNNTISNLDSIKNEIENLQIEFDESNKLKNNKNSEILEDLENSYIYGFHGMKHDFETIKNKYK